MGAFGYDGWSTAMEEAALGVDRELTRREERAIDAALRERAEDEATSGAEAFREWLVDSSHPNGAGGIALICVTCGIGRVGDADRADLIADARRNLIAEYVAHRVDAFTDDERAEVERDVCGEEA